MEEEDDSRRVVKSSPKVPIRGKRNVLITSALPYVNNVPHLGNIIGCVLSGDVFARYCRLRGYNVVYICGTDEYGTATETKAIEENSTPQQICDKYHAIHKEVYDWFNISFDEFGRTSTPQQTEICQEIFTKLIENNWLSDNTMQQLFCENCNRFLADRLVEGTCPLLDCNYDSARGDQCEKCGKLLNPTELRDPKCKVCNKTPHVRDTEHLFLELPLLKEKLEEYINVMSVAGCWSQNAIQATYAWLKEGLKSRCITRDLKWGVPVPLEKFKDKVFYVWFDAPIGYVSITSCYTSDWELWWKNPENVELYQFMGKDNVPFHTVMFPSTLIGTGENWTLMKNISVTEYLNYETGKFSKSKGVGVFGNDAKDTNIPSEVWRYYLLTNRPEVSDTMFTWVDLQAKLNTELLNNLGNFINRVLSFIAKPQGAESHSLTQTLSEKISKLVDQYIEAMEKVKLKQALKIGMSISSEGNAYLQESQFWKLYKNDKDSCNIVMRTSVGLVYLLSCLLQPFMPSFSLKVLKQLGISHENQLSLSNEDGNVAERFRKPWELVPAGHKIGTPEPLFKELKDEDVELFRKKFAGNQADRNEASKLAKKLAKTIIVESELCLSSMAEVSEITKSEVSEQHDPQSTFDPKSMRKTKPGLKRLVLTISVLFSFVLGFPLLWKSVEIYRAPLPFREIDHLSAQLDSTPLQFPCHFQAIFIGFEFKSSEDLEASLLDRMYKLGSGTPECGTCGTNYTVSVVVDSGSHCIQSPTSKSSCPWRYGALSNVDFGGGDDEAVDESLESALGGCSELARGGKVYTVVLVNRDEDVRAVIGKYRHAWISGKVSETAALSRVAEIFVKVFVNGGKEEGSIHGEFMPVGADGKIVLSFNLLNSDPRDGVYDWDFRSVEEILLAPVIDALRPIANISVESQVLYHTPKSSFSYWDDKWSSFIFSTKDLPFFVNSNEWHLDTSIAAGGRSKILHFVVYVPSAKECPLLLQLENGEISKTNGFISPMWGGVTVWNPKGCGKVLRSKHPVMHTISQQDLQKVIEVFMGQLRQLFGLKSDNHFFGSSGISNLLTSERGFTVWELDVLSRQHACFNLRSCATTLGSLSRLVQSLPRMIIMDEIGKQVAYSLEAAKLTQNNASLGIYDASAVASGQARSLAEDAFFHPSIMSVSYYSFEHCFAVYSPFFLPVAMHVILAALREWRRYKQENNKYLAWKKIEVIKASY
ncbi:hypothetical protein G4B88_012972 [Cannabis sativa]|uniref:methionine--tRNA ligase n=1 Tax=Cannabis sativa TaxID=3483 RepID=A0A7J6FI49_CANSA|nr:hypothetical protein G4B88_012972 [Cannabis sativa]